MFLHICVFGRRKTKHKTSHGKDTVDVGGLCSHVVKRTTCLKVVYSSTQVVTVELYLMFSLKQK